MIYIFLLMEIICNQLNADLMLAFLSVAPNFAFPAYILLVSFVHFLITLRLWSSLTPVCHSWKGPVLDCHKMSLNTQSYVAVLTQLKKLVYIMIFQNLLKIYQSLTSSLGIYEIAREVRQN